MYFNFEDYSILYSTGKTGMKKRSTTLAILVQNDMNLKPIIRLYFYSVVV